MEVMIRAELTAIRELLAAPALREFRHVVAPDHPLVFKGPDVLLSAPDDICAIFVPTATERKNSAHLGARLIATRLAYPVETRCVLMWGERDFQSAATQDFDAKISILNRHAADLLATPDADRLRPAIGDQMRSDTMMRFDRALRASSLSYKWQRIYRRPDRTPDRID